MKINNALNILIIHGGINHLNKNENAYLNDIWILKLSNLNWTSL